MTTADAVLEVEKEFRGNPCFAFAGLGDGKVFAYVKRFLTERERICVEALAKRIGGDMTLCCSRPPMLRHVRRNQCDYVEFQCRLCGRKGGLAITEEQARALWDGFEA